MLFDEAEWTDLPKKLARAIRPEYSMRLSAYRIDGGTQRDRDDGDTSACWRGLVADQRESLAEAGHQGTREC